MAPLYTYRILQIIPAPAGVIADRDAEPFRHERPLLLALCEHEGMFAGRRGTHQVVMPVNDDGRVTDDFTLDGGYVVPASECPISTGGECPGHGS